MRSGPGRREALLKTNYMLGVLCLWRMCATKISPTHGAIWPKSMPRRIRHGPQGYAERAGKKYTTLYDRVKAYRVFSVTDIRNDEDRKKWPCLIEIHAAPKWLWNRRKAARTPRKD